MTIQNNYSLKNYNTFGINANAKHFVTIHSINELQKILTEKHDFFILGGGSNMLFTKDLDKFVLHIDLKGIKIIEESENEVVVEANAGENWHEFVLWTIQNNFGGLENMSLIPGNVGTTPIQNIGAYGAEIKDTMVLCKAIAIDNQEEKVFLNKDCKFGYRESIFKNEVKNQYIVTAVQFRLTKKNHKINSNYGDISQELALKNIENPTIKDISDAVIAIRSKKLPDPKVLGNSGSFFKNPIISRVQFNELKNRFPDIKYFEVSETEVKVPAGWLIEQIGFKGKRFGDAGVHINQALVLVNYGNATGSEILDLSKKIQQTVFEKYGIHIEAEVNIY